MPLDNGWRDMRITAAAGTNPKTTGCAPCASLMDAPWHVLYTLPNAELACELKLRREGAGVWLPMECRTLPDRSKRIVPLMSRYLFLQLTGERTKWGCTVRSEGGSELGSVLRTPQGIPRVVPQGVLEALWSQCGANGVLYPPEAREMRRGDAGRVLEGPFRDWAGVCAMTERERVALLLGSFARPVWFKRSAVEIA